MKQVILEILKSTWGVLIDLFDSEINHCMSKECRKIFAHKEDRQKYIEAARAVQDNGGEQTITLHTGEVVTLV